MDNKIALAGKFGIGCPATIAFLEELTACGIRRFVGIGSAGALHDDIKHGDVILCTGAFSDEGTSAHYPGYDSYSKPSRILTRQLALWFNKRQLPFTKGKTWTIDTPYRETKEKLKYFLDAGADVVEMESSAMFTVARFRKVAVANVFVVGDSISGGIWKPDFTSAVIRQKSLSVARDIILLLDDLETLRSVNRMEIMKTSEMTIFEVDSYGTISASDCYKPKRRADFYEIGDYDTCSPKRLIEAAEKHPPLQWLIAGCYTNYRKNPAHPARLKTMPENSDKGWIDWVVGADKQTFSALIEDVNKWLSEEPNWSWEEDYFVVSGDPERAAFELLKDEPDELLDALGVLIVEGDRPGSNYCYAELSRPIEEANTVAEGKGLDYRFQKKPDEI